ncbi:M81 family metallopeptidase [Comamonadaceae bacterium G21597-S1]|nr:M81 family metallopeptidase [Comamonadaceae bacterium G21597-S1]
MPRILAAAFKHETNTFSPLPTDLAAYAARCLRHGADIPAYFRGTATEMGAFIDAAEHYGWELVHTVAADATPSGKVTRAAFDTIAGTIETALREQGPFDAVLLCLHGAMVAEHVDDGEGELVRRLRAVAGDRLPIGITLDLHANVTDAMARLASVIVSYRTYPHVDQYDTGKRCADLIARTLDGAVDPVCTVARGAMIDAVDHGRTTAPGPMLETLAHADTLRAQAPGVLDIGINAGFPWADIEAAGPSVVIVRDRKAGPRDTTPIAATLLERIWRDRRRTTVQPLPLPAGMAAIRDALARPGDGIVLVADCADNPGGGGLEDSVALLGALIEARVDTVAFGMICDPATLQACVAAGAGATLAVRLGGHSGGAFQGPLALQGQVMSVQPGQFTFTGPMSRGIALDIGTTAVLRVGGIDIVVAGTRHQVLDPGFFTHAGLDPTRYALVVVKSSQHFRAAFGPMARQILVIDSGDGLTSFDLAAFGHTRVRRPVHPLDELPD